MTHGSLFSGIGGFDLAAEWAGWENKFHCENNEFCNKVLKYYWPNAKSYGDIKEAEFTIWRGLIDVLSGGFPCQPYSLAGKRKGNQDDRHLWPYMLAAIKSIQPRWVVGENVYGLINWSKGLVFHEVQTDLEAAGYEVWPYVLPACSINAPHRRDRIWFVAHNSDTRTEGLQRRENGVFETNLTPHSRLQRQTFSEIETTRTEQRNQRNVAHSEQPGRERADKSERSIRSEPGTWDNWPTVEPTIRGRNDGLPGRLAGITFPKHRNESIKGYGNAIVPNLVYEIFKTIEQYENILKQPQHGK